MEAFHLDAIVGERGATEAKTVIICTLVIVRSRELSTTWSADRSDSARQWETVNVQIMQYTVSAGPSTFGTRSILCSMNVVCCVYS
jgi:hypothetical protein